MRASADGRNHRWRLSARWSRQPDDVHLLGLKRQLEKDYAIKLGGDDFFKKVKTVGDLVKAVQQAVKDRPETPIPDSKPTGIRPDRPPEKIPTETGSRPDRPPDQ
jgi:hypothetical protein